MSKLSGRVAWREVYWLCVVDEGMGGWVWAEKSFEVCAESRRALMQRLVPRSRGR